MPLGFGIRMTIQIKRESLVTRVVALLQRELPQLANGKWLPGERELSRRLQVSRTTLRAALDKLRRQGLIRAHPQRGYQVLIPRGKHRHPASRTIGWFMGSAIDRWDTRWQIMNHEVERGLAAAGYELKVFVDSHLPGGNRGQQLARLVAGHPVACWVLNSVSFETQQWFEQRGVATLVWGSCYPGIDLPNLDVDYRAIGRHAAGLLWKLGHRRLGYLTPRVRLGGDIQGEQGFLAAVRQLSGGALTPNFLYHNGSAGDIQRALDASLSGKRPVTALVIARPLFALTALTYSLSRGLRIPGELSLVCRDDSEFLEPLVPALARYSVDRRLFARRGVRTLIQLATSGCLNPRARWMIAQYIKGDTIAPPAAPVVFRH